LLSRVWCCHRQVVTKLHQLLKPFMLRRMKADVEIFLPRKQEILLYAPMSEEQLKINKQLLDGTLGVSCFLGRGLCWWCVESFLSVLQGALQLAIWGQWKPLPSKLLYGFELTLPPALAPMHQLVSVQSVNPSLPAGFNAYTPTTS
jgi:hypothetical protein